jgi:hypothetical protein
MGRHLFGARERKDKIVGTIAEPRKKHTLAADSENTLRESMGVYFAELDRQTT